MSGFVLCSNEKMGGNSLFCMTSNAILCSSELVKHLCLCTGCQGELAQLVSGKLYHATVVFCLVSHPVTNPLPRTHASRMFDVSSLVTPHVDKDTLYPTSCRTHVL
jgi:hypothetical protein